MIQLVPMQEDAFQAYLKTAIQDYAQDKIDSGNWHPSEAIQKSKESYQELLPDGLASKNQYLYSIMVDGNDLPVGMIWFAEAGPKLKRQAFIYDFIVFEPFRRRGYGAQALLAVEEIVKALDLQTIALHVFGHNNGALALYQKVGYQITNINMAKSLEV